METSKEIKCNLCSLNWRFFRGNKNSESGSTHVLFHYIPKKPIIPNNYFTVWYMVLFLIIKTTYHAPLYEIFSWHQLQKNNNNRWNLNLHFKWKAHFIILEPPVFLIHKPMHIIKGFKASLNWNTLLYRLSHVYKGIIIFNPPRKGHTSQTQSRCHVDRNSSSPEIRILHTPSTSARFEEIQWGFVWKERQ